MEKSGIDYMPFPMTFFENTEIELMDAEFGCEASSVLLRLFCSIFRNGFYYRWNDDVQLLFARRSMLGVITASTVGKIVEKAIFRKIFSRELFDRYGILTSVDLQKHYFSVVSRRKMVQIGHPEYLLVDVSGLKNVELKQMDEEVLVEQTEECRQEQTSKSEDVDISSENVDIFQQSKEEKSKEKKRKENSPSLPLESVSESLSGSGSDKPADIGPDRERQHWDEWKQELLKDDGWRISVINQSGRGTAFNEEIPAKLDRFCDFLISSGQSDTVSRRRDFVRRFHYWLMDDVKHCYMRMPQQGGTSKFEEANQVVRDSLPIAEQMLKGIWQ